MIHLLVCERFIEDIFATNVVLGNEVPRSLLQKCKEVLSSAISVNIMKCAVLGCDYVNVFFLLCSRSLEDNS